MVEPRVYSMYYAFNQYTVYDTSGTYSSHRLYTQLSLLRILCRTPILHLAILFTSSCNMFMSLEPQWNLRSGSSSPIISYRHMEWKTFGCLCCSPSTQICVQTLHWTWKRNLNYFAGTNCELKVKDLKCKYCAMGQCGLGVPHHIIIILFSSNPSLSNHLLLAPSFS